MDTKNLETIRIAALKHVQRCIPTCRSSTTCRFRHKRKHLRNGEPCMHEFLHYRRFVLEVTQGQTAFDLLQAAMDAALLDLLVDRCSKRLAGFRALIEEANMAIEPGPGDWRSRQGVKKASLRPEVNLLMRLIRRKNKLIDKCRALRQDATEPSPPEQLSFAEFTQAIMEIGGQDIHDAIKEGNPTCPMTGVSPGRGTGRHARKEKNWRKE